MKEHDEEAQGVEQGPVPEEPDPPKDKNPKTVFSVVMFDERRERPGYSVVFWLALVLISLATVFLGWKAHERDKILQNLIQQESDQRENGQSLLLKADKRNGAEIDKLDADVDQSLKGVEKRVETLEDNITEVNAELHPESPNVECEKIKKCKTKRCEKRLRKKFDCPLEDAEK